MFDCCIIGGGIIGLSIARELAGRGLGVRVVSREPERDTASWAAAGIFPPAPRHADESAAERLTSWSDALHRDWSRDLREETGIDNGLFGSGGLHLAADEGHMASVREEAHAWRTQGARCDLLDGRGVAACEPGLRGAVERGVIAGGYFLPDEMQIRPPRHLAALVESCRRRGVALSFGGTVERLGVGHGTITGVDVRFADGRRETIEADVYCLAAGAWTGQLARHLGLTIDTRPIRGQIALYRFPAPPLARVVNLDLEYLVPRGDGRVLVGSTLEDAGFDLGTTADALGRLSDLAKLLLGDMETATLERTWSGLRPASIDGLPSIGRIPGCSNAFVASGHYRAGLHQSTGTAMLIADLVTNRTPAIDAAPFDPSRHAVTPR